MRASAFLRTRRVTRRGLTLTALAVVSVSCPPVECIQGRAADRAIRAIVSRPWSAMDEATAQGLLHCDLRMRLQPWEDFSGLAAAAEGLGRCCASCWECYWPSFRRTWGPAGHGLWHVSGYSCSLGPASAAARARGLVAAFGAPREALVYESSELDADRLEKEITGRYSAGYRWETPAGRLQLDIGIVCGSEGVGSCAVLTEADRCEPPEELAGIDLEAHPEARVFDVRGYADDPDRDDTLFLFVHIYSECHHHDSCCKEAEARRFWPMLEREAEARGATTVHTIIQDCTPNWSGPSFRKQEDGSWVLGGHLCPTTPHGSAVESR